MGKGETSGDASRPALSIAAGGGSDGSAVADLDAARAKDILGQPGRPPHPGVFTEPKLLERIDPDLLEQMTSREWLEPRRDAFAHAPITARELGLHPVTALRLERENLPGRGYDRYRDFLWPHRDLIRSAEQTIPGADEAARLVAATVQRGDVVAVYADYDVDGNTSAVILREALADCGADPQRVVWGHPSAEFGFGLSGKFVRHAHEQGASLLITLDCGSSQVAEVALARDLGMKVIVVDHHDPVPPADPDFHLNPQWAVLSRRKRIDEQLGEAKKVEDAVKRAEKVVAERPGEDEFVDKLHAKQEQARDVIRRLDSLLPPPEDPRVLGEWMPAARGQVAALEAKLGRRPSFGEVADAAGLTAEQARAVMEAMPSRTLTMARARLEALRDRELGHDTDTGAPLTWKLSLALRRETWRNAVRAARDADGDERAVLLERLDRLAGRPDSPSRDVDHAVERGAGDLSENAWRAPMWLAGLGLVADMESMRDEENRAFCRVPVDEARSAGRPAPVPPAIRLLAEHFEEDPNDQAALVRTRAVLNLPKRTPFMTAEHLVEFLSAPDDATARELAERHRLIEIYEDATAARDEIERLGREDWNRRLKRDLKRKRAHRKAVEAHVRARRAEITRDKRKQEARRAADRLRAAERKAQVADQVDRVEDTDRSAGRHAELDRLAARVEDARSKARDAARVAREKKVAAEQADRKADEIFEKDDRVRPQIDADSPLDLNPSGAAGAPGGDEYGPYFALAVVDGFTDYVGQSGVVANRFTRDKQINRPSGVLVERGPDAKSRPVYKASFRNDVVKGVKIGDFRDDQVLRDLFRIAVKDEETGEITEQVNLGGHPDLFSGAILKENVPALERRLEELAAQADRNGRAGWFIRERKPVWTTKRLVDPAHLPRLQQEAELFKPTTNGTYPTRISMAARIVEVGEFDAKRKQAPGVLEFTDGSRHECAIDSEGLPAARTGGWFEWALSLGQDFWLRDCRPIAPPASSDDERAAA